MTNELNRFDALVGRAHPCGRRWQQSKVTTTRFSWNVVVFSNSLEWTEHVDLISTVSTSIQVADNFYTQHTNPKWKARAFVRSASSAKNFLYFRIWSVRAVNSAQYKMTKYFPFFTFFTFAKVLWCDGTEQLRKLKCDVLCVATVRSSRWSRVYK